MIHMTDSSKIHFVKTPTVIPTMLILSYLVKNVVIFDFHPYGVVLVYCAVKLTCYHQQPLSLGLHLRALAVLFVCAAVERLTGLVDHRLLQVHLVGQDLHEKYNME